MIYGLAEPATGEIRYVGKTERDIRERFSEHTRPSSVRRTQPVYEWLRALGAKPQLVVLETDPGDIDEAERAWIATLAARGERLLNKAPGGYGGRRVAK